MPIDAHHRLILISLRIYVEHLIYTLLNNQNVSLCSQKSVELIKEWRYIYIYICHCKFWRCICRKYNTVQNVCYLIYI